ncbi:unnamed protein product [Vitrella brassicaformis CCMP3155]|uniref:Uncharacterized protein n=1 Tax=Vitrella brassicaformis (strain CCMP3155) TaxID=1169540 RepID=A0A0G4EV70_VITBC|nr:unnamed protein product [Vitrella brassicaformis CCMP3155]|eukprot:CEM02160.1 unnamed protein product [Vitrella brassicaformis CCMP3155]
MTRGNQRDKDRQRAAARAKQAPKGACSQLDANKKALTIVCSICKQQFMGTSSASILNQHAESKHPKSSVTDCFPHLGGGS